MSNFIQVDDVSYSYSTAKEVFALKNVSLSVKKGEFLCILGANGSGKSTLAKHLNGLLLPTKGQVIVEGLNTQHSDFIWEIRNKVGMVFQNPDNQIVASVVEEEVAFGLENLGVPSVEIRAKVDEALKLVGMAKYRQRGTQFLSGGQKQLVCIAGVMAMEPDCLVLDEPTAMLDPQGRQEVLKTVRLLNRERKITVVLITHNMEESLLADRIIVMAQGQKMQEGTPREVFLPEQAVKKAGLEVPVMIELANRLRAKGLAIPKEVMTIEEMVHVLCE